MVTAVPPVQIGSVGLEIQVDAIRAAHPASDGLAEHWAMVTAVPGQAPGLAVQRAAQPARFGLAEHWAMVTAVPPVQAPGDAAHKSAQPASDGSAEHWAIVTAVPPVPGIVMHPPDPSGIWVEVQVCCVTHVPFSIKLGELQVTVVPPGQAPGDAAHNSAQPASDGLAEHCAMVTAVCAKLGDAPSANAAQVINVAISLLILVMRVTLVDWTKLSAQI